MIYEVEISEQADRDLRGIFEYIAFERPTIVWDFHSLLLGVQMMFSFMLTDEKSSLKVCKHCGKAFVASRPNSVFCSGKCKNRYNVYKSRAKDKDNAN